jgi:Notch-like protein
MNSDGSFHCECLDGWTGLKCDQDINECKLEKCSGFGICVNTDGSYSCNCQKGHSGRSCEIIHGKSTVGMYDILLHNFRISIPYTTL